MEAKPALKAIFEETLLQDPIICGMAGGRSVGPGTWSPDGKRIAFVWARDGEPHLWTIPAVGGWPRQITRNPVWTEMGDLVDRRDVAGGPQWSPDGRHFAYVAPASAGSTGIFVIPSSGGDAVQLTDHPRCDVCPSWRPNLGCDRTPHWSPDGKMIAFVCSRDGPDQIWVVARDGRVGPLQVTYDRYDNNDIQWAPDGTRIAFSSQRNADDIFKSAICVVSARGGKVRQLTDGQEGNDRTPRWSPGGRSIAFVSDRGGYDDIWLISSDGEDLRQLTEGPGDKGDPRWSPDGSQIVYTSVRGVNTDIWRVSVNGGPSQRLTEGDGVHQAPAWSPDGREILYLSSGPHRSPDLWKIPSTGGAPTQLTFSMLGDVEAIDPIRPEIVTFPSEDNLEIESLLFRPRDLEAGRLYPAVMWIHGGPNAHLTNQWYPYFQYLAKQGYVVLVPNCRGSTGYGRAFREENLDYWGGRDALDWLSAVDFLDRLGYVDTSRVAIWGSSYGGFAVLLALTKFPDVFRAGICHYGPSDLIGSYDDTRIRVVRRLLRRQMGSLPIENLALWQDRSPLNFADQVKAPLMILQGQDDSGVHPRQASQMAEALWAQAKICELTIYEGEGHGFSRPATIADVASKVEEFLARHLMNSEGEQEDNP